MLWSIAGIFMKLLPWNGFAVAGIRSLIAGTTIGIYMALIRCPFRLNRRTVIAGLFAGLTYTCFTMANKLTTAANAIVLQFTSPVFILVFSALLYHQKIRKGDVVGGLSAVHPEPERGEEPVPGVRQRHRLRGRRDQENARRQRRGRAGAGDDEPGDQLRRPVPG